MAMFNSRLICPHQEKSQNYKYGYFNILRCYYLFAGTARQTDF
jgi:hypothetical protein